MIPFPFKWKPVFFFCCRLSTSWLVVYKFQERKESSIMSESDIMFNEWDRRCATVQLMLSTDPSYDNSTLKMQIRMVQCLRAHLNASEDPLEVVEWKDTARKTRTMEFIEKVLAVIDESPQRPIRQIARDLDISHTTVNACVKEDLKYRSYRCQTSQILTEKTKNLWLIKSVRSPSSADLNSLDYFVGSYIENITNRTSHNTKASLIAAIHRVFAKLPPALVEKACSQFQIRIEAVIEAEGSYIE